MGLKVLLLFCMIFCHIVDDYYLQGWLASAKQKSWWQENAPDRMYEYDYLIALAMHAFSWSFMIMLPLTVCTVMALHKFYFGFYIVNMLIHAYVDNMKANKKIINLIQDQCLHLIQIVSTWAIVLLLYNM